MNKYKPLENRVIVEQKEAETKTASGIVLPDAAQEKPQVGTIVAVGQGKRTEKGDLIPLEVAVGDIVIFSKYGGTELVDQDNKDKKYLVIKESDILVVENK